MMKTHKLRYLVAQTPCDGPSELQPIYLTNPEISDVHGWSKPRIIQTNRRNQGEFWIDFWVICDQHKAHLFYTDHAGSMFRLEGLVICRVMRHASWETTRKHYAPGDIQRDAEVLRAHLLNDEPDQETKEVGDCT